jgi:hypothetical protein
MVSDQVRDMNTPETHEIIWTGKLPNFMDTGKTSKRQSSTPPYGGLGHPWASRVTQKGSSGRTIGPICISLHQSKAANEGRPTAKSIGAIPDRAAAQSKAASGNRAWPKSKKAIPDPRCNIFKSGQKPLRYRLIRSSNSSLRNNKIKSADCRPRCAKNHVACQQPEPKSTNPTAVRFVDESDHAHICQTSQTALQHKQKQLSETALKINQKRQYLTVLQDDWSRKTQIALQPYLKERLCTALSQNQKRLFWSDLLQKPRGLSTSKIVIGESDSGQIRRRVWPCSSFTNIALLEATH